MLVFVVFEMTYCVSDWMSVMPLQLVEELRLHLSILFLKQTELCH